MRKVDCGRKALTPVSPWTTIGMRETALNKRIQGIKTPNVMGKMRIELLDNSESESDDEIHRPHEQSYQSVDALHDSVAEIEPEDDTDTEVEMEDPDDDGFGVKQEKTSSHDRKRAKIGGGHKLQSRDRPSKIALAVKPKAKVPPPKKEAEAPVLTQRATSAPYKPSSSPNKLTIISPYILAELRRNNAELRATNIDLSAQNKAFSREKRELEATLAHKSTQHQQKGMQAELTKLRMENEELKAKVRLLEECGVEWARICEVRKGQFTQLQGAFVAYQGGGWPVRQEIMYGGRPGEYGGTGQ